MESCNNEQEEGFETRLSNALELAVLYERLRHAPTSNESQRGALEFTIALLKQAVIAAKQDLVQQQ